MKLKRVALLALLFCAACKQQDAALAVTMSGPFRIPADANKLSVDVFDGAIVIKHKQWCTTVTADCPDALAPQPSFSATLTLVESGADHPRVKINVTLSQGTATVGLGTMPATFQSGQTTEVIIALTPP